MARISVAYALPPPVLAMITMRQCSLILNGPGFRLKLNFPTDLEERVRLCKSTVSYEVERLWISALSYHVFFGRMRASSLPRGYETRVTKKDEYDREFDRKK